jgi:curved DNA-binding protein CbpA
MHSKTSSDRPDPYVVLGVDRRADAGEIKRAYFQLVRQHPPESAPERFQEVRAAYEQLRSPERRAQADLFLVQPPPEIPARRGASYDLSVHAADIVAIALALHVATLRIEDDFHEPALPR